MFTRLHPEAQRMSHLRSIAREYSLYEIATMTRAAPAKLLGMEQYGHLGDGANADITIYRPHDDPEEMFSTPEWVFKDGKLIVNKGKIVDVVSGKTHVVKPDFDSAIEKPIKEYYDDYQTVAFENFKISNDEMVEHIGSEIEVHPITER